MKSFMRASAVLGATFFLLVAVSGCGPSTPEECIDRAALAASAGEWKSAFKLSSRAVKLAPDNVDALVLKAVAAHRCGKPEAAVEAASRAAEIDPGNFAAQYTLGLVCMDDPSRSGKAMHALLRALKLRTTDRDTLVLLCNLGERVASPNLLTFLKMLQRDPEYSAHPALYNQLGVAYLRRRELDNARKAFTTAWKYGRNDPEITYNTACFFDRYSNSATTAAALYRRYLELAAGDGDAAATRAQAAARMEALSGAKR